MWKVGGPEEFVFPHAGDHAGERALVGIAGDPALALEVDTGLLGKPRVAAERRRIDRVHALDPVPDPSRARLEDDDLQAREFLEHPELEHRGEGVTDAVGCGDVDDERERRVGHPPEPSRRGPEGLEPGMDRDRQPEILGHPEYVVMVRVSRRLSRHHEGRDEHTLHAVTGRPLDLARGFLGQAERDVRDGHQAPAAPGAELDDPAVVGTRVGLGELQILALRLPENAERRIENGEIEVLVVETRDPLCGIPRPESRVVEVPEAGPLPPRW